MFDPDLYRKTCSEGLRLSGESLEEMIVMTENKKRGLRKPLQIALTAAALAVVMCVTAAAANPEAVEKLWKSFSVSVLYEGGNTVVIETDMPDVAVVREGERVILTVDEEKTDITEALARDSVYKKTFASENGDAELTVQSDLTWEMELHTKDGQEVTYNSKSFEIYYPSDWEENPAIKDEQSGYMLSPGDDSVVTYTFTDDESVPNATYLPPEE